jgi:hypothetical protein
MSARCWQPNAILIEAVAFEGPQKVEERPLGAGGL